VSPTTAAHVRSDLGEDVDVVLDGGACDVGVESTIVDFTGGAPVLLRPGGVTAERIEAVLGLSLGRHASEGVRAPGMLESHYAPRARVELVPSERLMARAEGLAHAGQRVAVLLAPGDARDSLRTGHVLVLDLGRSNEDAAQRLYAALRQADLEGADVVLASIPEPRGLGEALADRLMKAAGPR
jgi:L-threonylcarbamoyladenylate synthase